MAASDVEVRAIRADERADWEPLWKGYQAFYKVEISDETTTVTWARLHDPAEPMAVLGAYVGGHLCGIVHYLFHRSCWTIGNYCYLQDLFVAENARHLGVGRALIAEVDEVASFLDPTVRALMPDPHTLADMRGAATRLADAVTSGETVAILGDYDVDGATSAALLGRYLHHCGLRPIVHIPDRLFEGYGPNAEAVGALAARGASLLVTVDCGTTSHEPLAQAPKPGLAVILSAHHQADERPPAGRAG